MPWDSNVKKQFIPYRLVKLLTTKKLLLVLYLFCIAFTSKAQSTSLSAIGNVAGAPAEMKFSELKSILMGEKQRWKNGDRILIALMKTNTPTGKATSEKVYDMSGDELNKFWLALVFQGKAQPPKFFGSADELENFVSQNPGAIGILDKLVPGSDIKSITINGEKTF